MKKFFSSLMLGSILILTTGCTADTDNESSNGIPSTQPVQSVFFPDNIYKLMEDPHDPEALINQYEDLSDYVNDTSKAIFDSTADAVIQKKLP